MMVELPRNTTPEEVAGLLQAAYWRKGGEYASFAVKVIPSPVDEPSTIFELTSGGHWIEVTKPGTVAMLQTPAWAALEMARCMWKELGQ